MTDALDRVRKELSQLPPPEFTGTRDRRAGEARDRGDEQLAASIKKLRKPTAAAWAVNLLAAKSPKQLDSLLSLGEQLRSAQREMRGDDLRELAGQRSRVVQGLAQEAVELARRADHPLSDSAREQVEQTLNAALSEPEAAHDVREGVLTKPVTYSGFGLDELSTFAAARSVAAPRQEKSPARRRTGRNDERDRRQRELKEARGELEHTSRELRQIDRELKQAQDRQRRTEQRRARLAEELADLDAEVRQYSDEATDARRRRERIQRQHTTQEKRVKKLET